ncbi:hypothetical protein [Rathayibacter sp. VKM Ac-2878]|nr:hypothetical protein [Rathayibacter sp. VKM Ac-2878]MBF4504424.1 hypothetical protein [Rathayibacter sp. VKM Ac-2878]
MSTETPMFSNLPGAMIIITPLFVGFCLWAFWSTRAAWKLRRTGSYEFVSSFHVRPSQRSSLLSIFPGVELSAVEARVPISVDSAGIRLWKRGLPLREIGEVSFSSIIEPIVATSTKATYGFEGAIRVKFRRENGSVEILEIIVGSPLFSGLFRASDSRMKSIATQLELMRQKYH